jgi:hypothetical protein
MAEVALKFGPAEYFSLMVFGLAAVASAQGWRGQGRVAGNDRAARAGEAALQALCKNFYAVA